MTESFSTNQSLGLSDNDPQPRRRRVLVTGAAGRIGRYFAKHSSDRNDLRLMVQNPGDGEAIEALGEVVVADLRDLERMKEVCRGIDTVVHLAADPSPRATWDNVIDVNITGTYHVFVAAKAAGCRRVVYASSIHAVSGYPVDVQVKADDPVNPGDLYGVSKCFGEAMGRYMAEQEDVSTIAIRIGAFQPAEAAESPKRLKNLDAWVSPRDMNQLIQRSIDNETIRFAIVHGLSDNCFKRMDISAARTLLGYKPQDDFTRENIRLRDLHLRRIIEDHAEGDEVSGLRDDL